MTARLRFILVIILLAAQAATVLALIWASQGQSARSLEQHGREEIVEFAEVVERQTVATIGPASRLAATTAELVADGSLPLEDDAGLDRYLYAAVRVAPEIAGAFVGRPDGSFVFVSRTGPDEYRTKRITVAGGRRVALAWRGPDRTVIRRALDPADDYDPRTRPWYRSASTSGRPGFTDPYVFFSSKRSGITAYAPVREGVSIRAVVGVDIETTGISEVLERVPLSPRGSAFVFDRSGAIVAGPEVVDASAPTMVPTHPASAIRSAYAALGASAAARLARTTVVPFQLGESRRLAVFRPTDMPDGSGWIVGVEAPVSDFTESVDGGSGRVMAIVLVAVIVSCLLAVPLILGATRPLREFQRRARTDSLTQLANRGELERAGAAIVASAVARGEPVAVALLDCDGFKTVNDTLGHAVGDELLKEVGRRLAGSFRREDLVARFGGDEFAVVIPGIQQDDAFELVERARRAITRDPVSTSAAVLAPRASAGVAAAQGSGVTLESLLAAADAALLRAKAAGKGRTEPGILVTS